MALNPRMKLLAEEIASGKRQPEYETLVKVIEALLKEIASKSGPCK